jgi:hypothetical protein
MKRFSLLLALMCVQAWFTKVAGQEAGQTFNAGKYPVSYTLESRKVTKEPRLEIMTEDHGTVVVDVVVDKYGNVLTAAVDKAASNGNAYLCTKAKQAAETTHFDAVPTAPLKSKGRMVFVF